MNLNLKDKVALVTGGSRGLGKAICLALAAEGAKVAVNYRHNDDLAEAVVAEINSAHGTEALAVEGDVSRQSDVTAMFDRVEERFSPVDVLVNNAAVCPTCQVKDMTEDQWRRTLDVNLTGTFLTCREMVRRLLAEEKKGTVPICAKHPSGRPGKWELSPFSGLGRIVNVSSQAAFRGSTTGHAPYDASKGGMVSFTVSLAREVAGNAIAVNAVAPGMMLTEMTAQALEANPEKYLARIPLGRIAETKEIAAVVVFLASEAASYMTGATVDVSGGMLMR